MLKSETQIYAGFCSAISGEYRSIRKKQREKTEVRIWGWFNFNLLNIIKMSCYGFDSSYQLGPKKKHKKICGAFINKRI